MMHSRSKKSIKPQHDLFENKKYEKEKEKYKHGKHFAKPLLNVQQSLPEFKSYRKYQDYDRYKNSKLIFSNLDLQMQAS